MRTIRSSLLILGVLALVYAGRAAGQEPAATPTVKARTAAQEGVDVDQVPKTISAPPESEYPDIDSLPKPSAASTPSGYPDIESMRKPGSTANLFPAQPTPTPLPGTLGGRLGQNRLGTTQGGRRTGGGAFGRKKNSGRQHDVLVDLADADPLQVRVAYRQAKTVAMANDPGMADLLHQADAAETDVEKRGFLKEYYTRLYSGIEKADPSPELKKHVDVLKMITEARYDPRRRDVGGDEDIVLGRGGGRRGGGRNR